MRVDVIELLKSHGHQAAADLIAKNLTVGDVHQTTALTDRKKTTSFKDRLAEAKKPPIVRPVDVDKGEWSLPLDIVKSAPEQQQIFGWASVTTVGGSIVVDKQGSMIPTEEIEKAAYDFVLYSRQQGDMHDPSSMGVGRLIESFVFTKQKQELLGIDLGMEGWWTGFKVDHPALWADLKAGKKPEFSIGGRGRRIEVA